jgi:hypothetical protein
MHWNSPLWQRVLAHRVLAPAPSPTCPEPGVLDLPGPGG